MSLSSLGLYLLSADISKNIALTHNLLCAVSNAAVYFGTEICQHHGGFYLGRSPQPINQYQSARFLIWLWDYQCVLRCERMGHRDYSKFARGNPSTRIECWEWDKGIEAYLNSISNSSLVYKVYNTHCRCLEGKGGKEPGKKSILEFN